MLNGAAHIPLMQDIATSTMLIGVALGVSVGMWITTRHAEWMAIAASTFVLVYMVT